MLSSARGRFHPSSNSSNSIGRSRFPSSMAATRCPATAFCGGCGNLELGSRVQWVARCLPIGVDQPQRAQWPRSNRQRTTCCEIPLVASSTVAKSWGYRLSPGVASGPIREGTTLRIAFVGFDLEGSGREVVTRGQSASRWWCQCSEVLPARRTWSRKPRSSFAGSLSCSRSMTALGIAPSNIWR
jgi:hypothetical protein